MSKVIFQSTRRAERSVLECIQIEKQILMTVFQVIISTVHVRPWVQSSSFKRTAHLENEKQLETIDKRRLTKAGLRRAMCQFERTMMCNVKILGNQKY